MKTEMSKELILGREYEHRPDTLHSLMAVDHEYMGSLCGKQPAPYKDHSKEPHVDGYCGCLECRVSRKLRSFDDTLKVVVAMAKIRTHNYKLMNTQVYIEICGSMVAVTSPLGKEGFSIPKDLNLELYDQAYLECGAYKEYYIVSDNMPLTPTHLYPEDVVTLIALGLRGLITVKKLDSIYEAQIPVVYSGLVDAILKSKLVARGFKNPLIISDSVGIVDGVKWTIGYISISGGDPRSIKDPDFGFNEERYLVLVRNTRTAFLKDMIGFEAEPIAARTYEYHFEDQHRWGSQLANIYSDIQKLLLEKELEDQFLYIDDFKVVLITTNSEAYSASWEYESPNVKRKDYAISNNVVVSVFHKQCNEHVMDDDLTYEAQLYLLSATFDSLVAIVEHHENTYVVKVPKENDGMFNGLMNNRGISLRFWTIGSRAEASDLSGSFYTLVAPKLRVSKTITKAELAISEALAKAVEKTTPEVVDKVIHDGSSPSVHESTRQDMANAAGIYAIDNHLKAFLVACAGVGYHVRVTDEGFVIGMNDLDDLRPITSILRHNLNQYVDGLATVNPNAGGATIHNVTVRLVDVASLANFDVKAAGAHQVDPKLAGEDKIAINVEVLHLDIDSHALTATGKRKLDWRMVESLGLAAWVTIDYKGLSLQLSKTLPKDSDSFKLGDNFNDMLFDREVKAAIDCNNSSTIPDGIKVLNLKVDKLNYHKLNLDFIQFVRYIY